MFIIPFVRKFGEDLFAILAESQVCFQDHGKGGLSLRGVAFMTVLAVLAVLTVLESNLPSFCLSYKIKHNEATVVVLTVLAVSRFQS